jgi:multiple antibiotic resistance protein
MISLSNAFLLSYAALFPIVNPIGNAPLFAGLTQGCSDGERNALAARIAINSFLLLLGSLFVGSYVLEFFGISVPVVRIAGGLVVTAFAWKFLHSDAMPDGDHGAVDEFPAAPDSFFPLTMPLTVGPGSISVAITLGSQRPKDIDLTHLVLLGSATILGMLAIVGTVYLCYRFAHVTIAGLGVSGTKVVVRLTSFIMLCIGIQIIWSGWIELTSLPR